VVRKNSVCRLPLRVSNSESGHEKVFLLLEVSEVVIG